MPDPVLVVDDLRVATRSGKVLLEKVCFEVSAGEQLGLIGESGSGKSVTAMALCGLLPRGLQATGSIRIGDIEIVGASERQLCELRGARIALVSQDPARALDPLMRVGAQVAEPLRRHRGLNGTDLAAAVRSVLSEVALSDLDRIVRSFPHELSGGQRQRVALAMALSCEPDLLIADEPTTALDATVQAEVVSMLVDLTDRHQMALVFISHDIALVSMIVDHTLVMKDGAVVDRGPITQLIAQPGHPYTEGLVNSATRLENALQTGSIQ